MALIQVLLLTYLLIGTEELQLHKISHWTGLVVVG